MLEILKEIRLLQMGILLTYCIFLYYYKYQKTEAKLLFWCLTAGVLNEVVSVLFTIYKISIHFNTTIYVIIHGFLWLQIIKTISTQKKIIVLATTVFLTFAVVNLFLIEGLKTFNTLSFILVAILYIIIFIYDSYMELKIENLNYFTSNSYILLVAPVFYFICFSLSFGFKNHNLNQILLFGNTSLYAVIACFANFFYCVCIIYYVYKENKLKI